MTAETAVFFMKRAFVAVFSVNAKALSCLLLQKINIAV